MTNLLRTAEDTNRFMLALAPVDEAFRQSEARWGVGRLERLISQPTLAAYQRGWDAYRRALDDGDGPSLEEVGPKMVAALAFMDSEATNAGHKPLDPSTWEAPLSDGRVLCVVRTNAEASAVIRAEREKTGRSTGEKQGENTAVTFSAETTIPPDLAMTIRTQHEGRALVVITMAEIARLLLMAEGEVSGTPWQGTEAHSGVQREEGMAADLVRSGWPLEAPLATDKPRIQELAF
jgi:hypothetical protein